MILCSLYKVLRDFDTCMLIDLYKFILYRVENFERSTKKCLKEVLSLLQTNRSKAHTIGIPLAHIIPT